MKLSSELISQFVKITNDEPKKKNESTVYATAVDGSSVQIDGSDRVIPVESLTAVKLESGDRVTVQIKDHTAIVTGNLTDPSAKGSNVDTLGTAVAKALTVDDITAENGRIKTLLTNHLTVDDIEAEDGRIAKLVAGLITSEELDVERGRIETLETADAEINSLIFDGAAGDTIHTNFSNSVIAQLGDAQIKSAMIESISADKITAGDIITNNVRIKSEDGKMILSDETLQISDGTNVRVQIGKDASNDYSINIYDQNGNLMFSKGGITDAAIKDAIIRNDMVSPNANIHASKLDIDSLFEEINADGSNVIKSAKIKLDDRNLTLDVAFKQLEDTISSQGAAIAMDAEAIETKVWQQDINAAKNEMSTLYSTLEQEVDSFKVSVSETYATVAAAEEAMSSAELANEQIVETKSLIEILSDSISTLITDSNGASLMKQTEDGWTFSTGDIQDLVNATSENLDLLIKEFGDVENAITILQQTVNDLGTIADYVKIGTYENEPCIELGEIDSSFKLRITNTRMIFTEGPNVLAYFNNQSLHIKKAVVEDEFQQGEFVWKVRSNGNLGLIWKGGNS